MTSGSSPKTSRWSRSFTPTSSRSPIPREPTSQRIISRGDGAELVARRLSARAPLHVPEPGDRAVRILGRRLPCVPGGVAAARADGAGQRHIAGTTNHTGLLSEVGSHAEGRLRPRRQGRGHVRRSAEGVPAVSEQQRQGDAVPQREPPRLLVAVRDRDGHASEGVPQSRSASNRAMRRPSAIDPACSTGGSA